jgi:spore maturation protein SpmB
MKPFSGSAARGLMLETFESHGVDSFVGKLAATFQGSTETTFYVLAIYFGSVGVTKTRYAAGAGLLADAAGILAAIFIAYLFYQS